VSTGDCFIKIDQVPGEAEDEDHKGEIQVTGWKWGMQGHYETSVKAGANVRELEFCHLVDSASPGLMQRLVQNKPLTSAVLTMRRAGQKDAAGKPLNYLEIGLYTVRIADIDVVHDAQNVVPLERVRLAFERIEVKYTPQNAQGSAGGGKKTFEHLLTRKT